MSKNITIQEGGQGKQFTAHKLKTNLVGGGTCLWVPEDETNLGTKHISENGTYNASDDGYYGYSSVTVSGVGSVTGTDGDGDEATVTKGQDGGLVTEKIPSSIRVTTPPTKTVYNDGDAIEYGGMVVKAYLKTGGLYGTIPTGDLTLPVTTAKYSEGSEGSATSDVVGNLSQPIAFGGACTITRYYEEYASWYNRVIVTSGSVRSIGYEHSGNMDIYLLSNSPFTIEYHIVDQRKPTPTNPNPPIEDMVISTKSGSGREIHGKTVYVATISANFTSGTPTIDIPTYNTQPNNNDFYTIVYGDITSGSTQNIPVQWTRPGDGNTLESSFTISVNKSLGGATGGGGQAGDTGAGRND